MPARHKLSKLKSKAPKIPDYTCTDIDNIITKLERLHDTRSTMSKTSLKLLIRKLERLRSSNESLRESGVYWYEQLKVLLQKRNTLK